MEQYDFEKFGRPGADLTAEQCINRWERLKYCIENDMPDPQGRPNYGFVGSAAKKETMIARCDEMINKIKKEGV